jgi:hypothetical protein
MMLREVFLVVAVAAVGVLHTIVPDHWLPIALVAREHGWTRRQTGRAAFGAGVGHVLSTLAIGLIVWIAGVAVAARYGHLVDVISGGALIAFGLWISVAAIFEQRSEAGNHHHHQDVELLHDDQEDGHHHDFDHHHGHVHAIARSDTGGTAVAIKHRHVHRHADGAVHIHAHSHDESSAHDESVVDEQAPPLHDHAHKVRGRTALLFIIGSSPMVEGIPAFFAASRYGVGLIAAMSVVFAIATIATYVILCTYSADRLQNLSIGPLEKYGEVLSGAVIALVGIVFLVWPIL